MMNKAVVVLVVASILTAAPVLTQPPPFPQPGSGDRLLLATDEGLFEGPLPIGPLAAAPSAENFDALAFDADGWLLAVSPPGPAPSDPPVSTLFEIDADGNTSFLADFELQVNEMPIDLAFDRRGRLYLLTGRLLYWNPPEGAWRLIELDHSTGAVLGAVELDRQVLALAPAPEGLWGIGVSRLFRLDPDTGTATDAGAGLPPPHGFGIRAADVDSTGALWIVGAGATTDQALWRIDPETGSRRAEASKLPIADALAVRRQCQNNAIARCLAGGRFRAQLVWRDFADRVGDGKAATGHTADSALFWFFDASNWELIVKVLNGCEINGHFWIFAAATTNVGYTLRVRDLESGASWTVTNPLGERSPAFTDTTAFAICP